MISMGEIKNEAGFVDTDALMARKLCELSFGHEPDCIMNWQTDDETERWSVVFWWQGDSEEYPQGWYRVDDESLFSCLWRALMEYGETDKTLAKWTDEMMTSHHDRLRARYKELRENRSVG